MFASFWPNVVQFDPPNAADKWFSVGLAASWLLKFTKTTFLIKGLQIALLSFPSGYCLKRVELEALQNLAWH